MQVVPVDSEYTITVPPITNAAGAEVDPVGLVFKARNDDGDRRTLIYGTHAEVVRDQAGRYHVDFVPPEEGVWHWRAEADAPGRAFEGYFMAHSEY